MATAHQDGEGAHGERAHGERGDEWRLGVEPGDPPAHELAPDPVASARDQSHERLTRALHVITVEHLGWALVALYTIATRLVALGARPLDDREARNALYAFDLAGGASGAGYHPAYAGWLHLITAGFFGVIGASDCAARMVFALAGIMLVATAFALRPYLGRAGGLALGAMLALSPGVTWFSRASAPATAAAAMELITIVLYLALTARPAKYRAALLGGAAGLMMAADPSGIVAAAIFLAALAILGLYGMVTRRHVYLGARVWLDRYAPLLVTVIVTAAVCWWASQMMVPDGFDPARIAALLPHRVAPPGSISGLRAVVPPLACNDFLIVIAAAIGLGVIAAMRVRSRFAAWSVLWMAMSVGLYLWIAATTSGDNREQLEILVQMLVPMAVVGAIGLNWLHRIAAWRQIRIALLVLVLFTLHATGVADFVRATPDASEAPWARHGNLYWGADATTDQTRTFGDRAADGLTPAAATVHFDGAITAPIRWYLRSLRPVATAQAASVIVTHAAPGPDEDSADAAVYRFGAAATWSPDYATIDCGRALRFFLTGAVWSPVTYDEITLTIRRAGGSAPTVILTPGQ
ncbi:MAG: hypothetical protein IVW56_01555 [Candidatus Binataceae bacterium]|nr:hypothetical protein [Candidatus Binataceae bacterium]